MFRSYAGSRIAIAFSLKSLVLALSLSLMPLAAAQTETDALLAQKTELEIAKLEQEIAQLKKPANWPGPDWEFWLQIGGGFLAGIISTLGALRSRQGSTDLLVHERRLEIYPELLKITAPLAINFQNMGGQDSVILSRDRCAQIGHSMTEWYFGGGGLIMSNDTRNAYLDLARALTRAFKSEEELRAPVFPRDSAEVSVEKMKDYETTLFNEIECDLNKTDPKKTNLKRIARWLVLESRLQYFREAKIKKMNALEFSSCKSIEAWKFGRLVQGDAKKAVDPSQLFRDFVFLHSLSSKLRTGLAADIRGRRRPE